MAEIHNVRWPEIDDERWAPRTQAMVLLGAGIGTWAIVIAAVVAIWF